MSLPVGSAGVATEVSAVPATGSLVVTTSPSQKSYVADVPVGQKEMKGKIDLVNVMLVGKV